MTATITTVEGIRLGELSLLIIAAIAELSAFASIARHMWWPLVRRRVGRPDRKVTAFAQRSHNGRAIRCAAFVMFITGAVISLIERFSEPITVRSVFWTAGATLAFISWTLLDRRRWEMGVT
jgi:hypothetical protein